tara:strand:- start:1988 stop:2125 length:138 start_codon:yes stop_codon:yes gene_type:complete
MQKNYTDKQNFILNPKKETIQKILNYSKSITVVNYNKSSFILDLN